MQFINLCFHQESYHNCGSIVMNENSYELPRATFFFNQSEYFSKMDMVRVALSKTLMPSAFGSVVSKCAFAIGFKVWYINCQFNKCNLSEGSS